MRLILTVGFYLAYIRTFCDYLLTGKYSWMPSDPAGLLMHASSLDQVLTRPDGILLCVLFAAGCFGVAGYIEHAAHLVDAFIFSPGVEVHYDSERRHPGTFRKATPGSDKRKDVLRPAVNFDNWGSIPKNKDATSTTPPATNQTFSDYFGPVDAKGSKASAKKDVPPDQPTK